MQFTILIVILSLWNVSNQVNIKHRSRSHTKSKLKKDVPFIPFVQDAAILEGADQASTSNQNKSAVTSNAANQRTVKYEGWFSIAIDYDYSSSKYPEIQGHRNEQINSFGMEDYQKLVAQGIQVREHALVNKLWQKDESVPTFDSFYLRLYSDNELVLFINNKNTLYLNSINPKQIRFYEQECFEIQEIDQQWLVCQKDHKLLKELSCEIQKDLGQKCDADVNNDIIKQKTIQPLMIIPLPSPDCSTDWDYNFHGQDWVCKCNEGREQSPIDILKSYQSKQIDQNADFNYFPVQSSKLIVVFENNMVRIKGLNKPGGTKISFGSIIDVDSTIYDAEEIQIHTPAEHTIDGKEYDMEIQVIHRSRSGNMKNQAILSFIVEDSPGDLVQEINNWNLLNLPNPQVDKVNDFFGKPLNINNFIGQQTGSNEPFSYYKYMGSMTSPPCEENVVWFIHETPLKQGSTAINMIRDALNPPGKTPHDKFKNYDGSNREIQPIQQREVMYYDMNKGCSGSTIATGHQFKGHWEKLKSQQDQYFQVAGQKASGVPHSQVVSESEATEPFIDRTRRTDRYNLNSS